MRTATPWAMELAIRMVPVGLLNPAPYNPRKKLRRGDPEYDDIANSMREFGLVQNLVWNERTGNLVGGHQRLTVARNEFQAVEMPCVVVNLDDEAERKLNVMLNRVGQGLWDMGKLAELVQGLDAKAVDVFGLGFTAAEVEELLGTKPKEAKRDPDAEVTPPAKPKTKRGDLFQFVSADGLPCHWLLCGDSTDPADVDRLMNGHRARVLFTDPPYGVDYDNSQRGDGRKAKGKIANDALTTTTLVDFLTACFRNAHQHTMPECAAYVFLASKCHIEFETALRAADWEVRSQLIWAKHLALSRADYHWAHEPCLYACKTGASTPWFGDRCQTTLFVDDRPDFRGMKKEELVAMLEAMADSATVWDEKRDPSAQYIHPTQKPVSLARRAMRNSTLPRDNVLDLFGGSGSTLVAAEIDGRNAFLMEKDEGFCDAIVQRYFETFDEVLVLRNGKEINPHTFISAE